VAAFCLDLPQVNLERNASSEREPTFRSRSTCGKSTLLYIDNSNPPLLYKRTKLCTWNMSLFLQTLQKWHTYIKLKGAVSPVISEIVRCLKYSLVVLYGKLYATKLCIFLYLICESASRIRHIGFENLKNYCRSFSSSRAQKRCAPGDTAPLTH
jgi:hypothetical protein